MRVADQVGAVHLDAGVVAPLLRVADLVADQRQLLFGGFLCGAGHPGQRLDVVAEGLLESGDQLVHALLGRGRKVLLDPILADGLSKRVVGHGGALLPARLGLLLPRKRPAEKDEVLIEERLGQVQSLSVEGVPAQIAFPGVEGLARDEPVERLEELRRGHIQAVEVADADGAEIRAPVECGAELLEIDESIDVVTVRGRAQVGAAGGGLGQRGLNLHDRGGFFGGLLGRIAGQGEHLLQMLDVLGADGDETLGIDNVVVAVGQREAALEELGDLLRRILVVLPDVEVEEAVGSAVVLKLAEQGWELFGVGEAVDGCKGRLDRREGLLFHHVRVHAGGIEVAVLFLQRSFWVFGGGVQILPEQVAIPLPEQ